MPVLRLAQDNETGEITLEEMSPSEATELAQYWMSPADPDFWDKPSYDKDPTYNMATRPPRKARRFR